MRRTTNRRIQPLQDVYNARRTMHGSVERMAGFVRKLEDACLKASRAGYTVREIAAASGWSTSTVSRGIHAAEQREETAA